MKGNADSAHSPPPSVLQVESSITLIGAIKTFPDVKIHIDGGECDCFNYYYF